MQRVRPRPSPASEETRAAVEIHREITHDKMSADDLHEMLKEPGMMDRIAAIPCASRIHRRES